MHNFHFASVTASRQVAKRCSVTVLLLLGTLSLGACSMDNLLSVNTPDIVTPENLDGPAGLAVLRAGAFGDLALAVGGAAAGHGSTPGLVHHVSAFTDEVMYSGTFPTRRLFDERRVRDDNGDVNTLYRNLHRARASAQTAAEAFARVSPGDPGEAEMLALAAFTRVFLAENFCAGVSISNAQPSGEIEFGDPLTTQQLFEQALPLFDQAITASTAGSPQRYLASLGRGRTLVNLNRLAEAAQAVSAVPTAFRFDAEFSSNSARQQNGIYALTGIDRQYSVPDGESANGIRYRSLADPRIPWSRTPDEVGQDGTTAFFMQLKYASPSSAVALATGVEARLIEAEAALAAGSIAAFNAIHSALRASVGLPAVDATPMSPAQRVDFHFQERALWMYLTAHRLGDMRRLVRQYARPAESVFPSGAYFKGGTYGTDVNIPLPVSELNNPRSNGCIDRNA